MGKRAKPTAPANRRPILQALAANDLEKLPTLLNDIDLDGPFCDDEWPGETLLGFAVRTLPTDVVQVLLAAGADPNRVFHGKDKRRRNPVNNAARYRDLEMVQLLIAAGATCDAHELLAAACIGGDVKVVDFALQAGADPNQPESPLCLAIQYRHPEVVQRLVAAGADVNDPSDAHVGLYPLEMAVAEDSPENLACTRILLAAGADPEQGDERPLVSAAGFGSPDVVRALIDAGADLSACDMIRGTPLAVAIAEDRLENVVALLERGADPSLEISAECPKYEGQSPLQIARQARRRRLLPFLEAAARGEPLPDPPS